MHFLDIIYESLINNKNYDDNTKNTGNDSDDSDLDLNIDSDDSSNSSSPDDIECDINGASNSSSSNNIPSQLPFSSNTNSSYPSYQSNQSYQSNNRTDSQLPYQRGQLHTKDRNKALLNEHEKHKRVVSVMENIASSDNHIGLVVNKKSPDGKRYLIVHNIGAGQVIEDVLFDWKIIGHYTYRLS